MLKIFKKIKSKILRKAVLQNNFSQNEGVTFIELVIVISIFSILAGALLFNFSRFSRNISIQNMAQDIALQINSAQREAISGLTNDLLAGCDRTVSDCSPRYGVYLVARGANDSKVLSFGGPAGNISGGTTLIRFFDDSLFSPANGVLDVGGDCGQGNGECLDRISIGQGNYISKICYGDGNQCDTLASDGLNISFKRPFPDALIYTDDGYRHNYARITISSSDINTQSVDIVVNAIGQISIEAVP